MPTHHSAEPMPACSAIPPRRRLRARVLIAFALMALFAIAAASSTEPDEADDYIAGFVRYVHWPYEDMAANWTLCVGGDPAVDRDARRAAGNARGKSFVLRHVDSADGLDGCHVLDLTGADHATSVALLARSRGRPVLSVGRGADFCTAGGLICLREPGSERAFEVNLSAIRESGLSVSARLLRLGAARTPQDGAP
ncbi:MAG: YfiR family protein [Dokdonella sp.]